MTWNPSVRSTPIIVTASPAPNLESLRMKEMERAAAAAVAMAIADRVVRTAITGNGRSIGHASAWVIQGRMDTANRWFL